MDRFPGEHILTAAKEAASIHGCKLLICFGGNGRSSGFSVMSRNKKSRDVFIKRVAELLTQTGLDGCKIAILFLASFI